MTIINPQEAPHEELTPTEEKFIAIMEGDLMPRNHFEQQILLATQIYKEQNPSEVFDVHQKTEREAVMAYWEAHGYSEAFREIRMHPDFDSNEVLHGDATKITLEHLMHWKLVEKLPE